MEPDQAGAVESPGSLFPHRLCPACPDCTVFQRGQTQRNPNQAGAGGASKPAALDCFPLSFAPLPASPATSQHPNRSGPMAPWWA